MKLINIIATIIIASVVSFLMVQNRGPQESLVKAEAKSVYDRVIETGKIRCGYLIYQPAIVKDPNSGELSGVLYDFIEEIGRKLSLEIEWVEETGWSNFLNDLKTDRFDMMCGTAWKNSARGREGTPLDPFYYSAVATWVRADDDRFDEDVYKLNDPAYTISTIDGATPDFIRNSDFPKSQAHSLTELSPYSDMMLAVVTNKADATFTEVYGARLFLDKNPGTMKQVGKPLRYYGNVMWVKKGQQDFESMINTAIEEISNTDFLGKTFEKYNIPEGVYLKPVKPYQEANK